jgi:hypothetical protein
VRKYFFGIKLMYLPENVMTVGSEISEKSTEQNLSVKAD